MKRYQIAKAEEGTQEVENYLSAGWEPFAVVSVPILEAVMVHDRAFGHEVATGNYRHIQSIDMIWFRRETPT